MSVVSTLRWVPRTPHLPSFEKLEITEYICPPIEGESALGGRLCRVPRRNGIYPDITGAGI
jgi:hypothetical protein